MDSYNRRLPFIRFCFGAVVACLLTIRNYPGDFPPLTICNGGLADSLLAFAKLLGAVCFIEALTWAVWLLSDRRRVPPTQAGIGDSTAKILSGGELLGLDGSISSLLFAIALVGVGLHFFGIPDSCPPTFPNDFSLKRLLGGLIVMYGIQGGINYWLERSDTPLSRMQR
jgi:hypothetical protein